MKRFVQPSSPVLYRVAEGVLGPTGSNNTRTILLGTKLTVSQYVSKLYTKARFVYIYTFE